MAPGDLIRVEDLPAEIRSEQPSRQSVAVETVASVNPVRAEATAAATPPPGTLREFKEAAERAFLVEKLRENNWNISKTAEALDTPRSNLYKKLEQYGIKQEIDG
jgi:transcriptional regulator of acetoin/glycerol metabolism